jgi:hypothetical protein
LQAHYQDKDLLAVALRLFEADIGRAIAQAEYGGWPAKREDLARDKIDFWRRVEELRNGSEIEQQIWRQAHIDHVRDVHGREMTEEDLDLDDKMWSQLREDMAGGKPASESEAARYLRDLIERYPRKVRT